MSFKDCIDNAVSDGKIDQERANDAKAAYEQLEVDLGPADAAFRVANDARLLAAERLRKAELNAKAQAAIKAKIDAGVSIKKVVEDLHGSGGKTLRGRHDAIRRLLRGEMNDFLRQFRSNIVGGRRNKMQLANFVRERFGESTGDTSAREMSQAFGHTAESARKQFNDVGGSIKYRQDWGLPQTHNQVTVGKTDKQEWISYTFERMNRERMTDASGKPLTDTQLLNALDDVYENIATGGWASREIIPFGGSKSLANTRLDPRSLVFKNADSWLEYNSRFGDADPFRIAVGHIDGMAQDIAHMDVLGPSPNSTWEYAKQLQVKKAALTKDPKENNKAQSETKAADSMRDVWSGLSQSPQNRVFAKSMSSVRQYLVSAQLGSATISSITDFNSQRVAAGFVGLSKTGSLKVLVKLAKSKEFRDLATESGSILENAVDQGMAANRYSMEDLHSEVAGRLADFTLRSSGLSGLTQMQRDAFFMSASADIAKQVKKGWNDIDPRLSKAFEAFGINKNEWDEIRKAELYEGGGVKIIRAKEIQAVAGRENALKFMEFLSTQQEFAVPTGTIEAKAILQGRSEAGSVVGEVARSIAQYKSFPITVYMTHVRRIVSETSAGRPSNALTYAASFFIGATLLGGMAMQLKDITKGKNPKPMDSLDFWGAASLQGGGLGIFGDFLFSDVNRFGAGLAESILGPTVGLASDLRKVSIGNISQAIQGEDTNAGAEISKLVTDNTPLSSLWYARLAFEREVEEQLMTLLDPDAAEKFRRSETKANREGGGYYWKRGRSAIAGDGIDAPDFSGILGD